MAVSIAVQVDRGAGGAVQAGVLVVHESVAVVVHPIADLHRVRVDGPVGVVAVPADGNMTLWLPANLGQLQTEAIPVFVRVPRALAGLFNPAYS